MTEICIFCTYDLVSRCFKWGVCSSGGTSIGVSIAGSLGECHRACADNAACKNYNYDPLDGSCVLLDGCDAVDAVAGNCKGCFVGNGDCGELPLIFFTFLLPQ